MFKLITKTKMPKVTRNSQTTWLEMCIAKNGKNKESIPKLNHHNKNKNIFWN
jgi:hypothetical protein